MNLVKRVVFETNLLVKFLLCWFATLIFSLLVGLIFKTPAFTEITFIILNIMFMAFFIFVVFFKNQDLRNLFSNDLLFVEQIKHVLVMLLVISVLLSAYFFIAWLLSALFDFDFTIVYVIVSFFEFILFVDDEEITI